MKNTFLFAFLLLLVLPAHAQNGLKVELVTVYDNLAFYPVDNEIARYLLQGVKEGKIKPYLPVGNDLVNFSTRLEKSKVKKIQRYFDKNINDTITIRPSEWLLEVISQGNQIKGLALFIDAKYIDEKQPRHILFKYGECKKYLQTVYNTSRKLNKIDRLEAVWFDFEHRNKQISMVEALEQKLYKGVLRNADGTYPDEIFGAERWNKIKAKTKSVLSIYEPFFMQNSPTEQHTVLHRNVNFGVSHYPFEYSDFDDLPLKAQLAAIRGVYYSNSIHFPWRYGLRIDDEQIDSTQNYQDNYRWDYKENNFMYRLRDGILSGKIKLYYTSENIYEKGILKEMKIEDFLAKYTYFDANINAEVKYPISESGLVWKEYYYTDLQGNPTRTAIDLLTLTIPKGSAPDAQLGDIWIVSMKFSEVKAYFQQLYTESKGRIANIGDMSMVEALEKHQKHTSTVWKYFTPFDYDIVTIIDKYDNPANWYLLKIAAERAIRGKLKDKMNNISDMPAREKMPNYIKQR